jgi:hypothetical protein
MGRGIRPASTGDADSLDIVLEEAGAVRVTVDLDASLRAYREEAGAVDGDVGIAVRYDEREPETPWVGSVLPEVCAIRCDQDGVGLVVARAPRNLSLEAHYPAFQTEREWRNLVVRPGEVKDVTLWVRGIARMPRIVLSETPPPADPLVLSMQARGGSVLPLGFVTGQSEGSTVYQMSAPILTALLVDRATGRSAQVVVGQDGIAKPRFEAGTQLDLRARQEIRRVRGNPPLDERSVAAHWPEAGQYTRVVDGVVRGHGRQVVLMGVGVGHRTVEVEFADGTRSARTLVVEDGRPVELRFD